MSQRSLSGRHARIYRDLKSICAGLLLAITTTPTLADSIIDCPLRDEPFSLNTPFLDILLSPAASAVVKRHIPGVMEKSPPLFLRTEVPAFGAIISTGVVAARLQQPEDVVAALDAELQQLPVTDADRKARCARYDNVPPELEIPSTGKRILVFDKINGFDHGPSVTAATNAVKALAEQQGWGVVVTGKGGAFIPEILSRFDVVVWNNNSGDVLTLSQRKAFEDYIHNGGGFVGIHGSGGDLSYYWDWYAEQLLGARFIGHPMKPQFQRAEIQVEKSPSGIAAALRPGWSMTDEWYSFAASPRASNASVVATLDEGSYDPGDFSGRDLHMGKDHPIVWTRCVKDGRSFYTAIGHRPEVYHVPENLMLLREGLSWAMGDGKTTCHNGKQVKNR